MLPTYKKCSINPFFYKVRIELAPVEVAQVLFDHLMQEIGDIYQ